VTSGSYRRALAAPLRFGLWQIGTHERVRGIAPTLHLDGLRVAGLPGAAASLVAAQSSRPPVSHSQSPERPV